MIDPLKKVSYSLDNTPLSRLWSNTMLNEIPFLQSWSPSIDRSRGPSNNCVGEQKCNSEKVFLLLHRCSTYLNPPTLTNLKVIYELWRIMKISIMVRSRIDQNALHEPKTLIQIYCYSLRSQKKNTIFIVHMIKNINVAFKSLTSRMAILARFSRLAAKVLWSKIWNLD